MLVAQEHERRIAARAEFRVFQKAPPVFMAQPSEKEVAGATSTLFLLRVCYLEFGDMKTLGVTGEKGKRERKERGVSVIFIFL